MNDSDNLSDLLVLIRIYGFLSADVASDQQEMDQRGNGAREREERGKIGEKRIEVM